MVEYTCNSRRLRQWDYELQGNLGYIERSSFFQKKNRIILKFLLIWLMHLLKPKNLSS